MRYIVAIVFILLSASSGYAVPLYELTKPDGATYEPEVSNFTFPTQNASIGYRYTSTSEFDSAQSYAGMYAASDITVNGRVFTSYILDGAPLTSMQKKYFLLGEGSLTNNASGNINITSVQSTQDAAISYSINNIFSIAATGDIVNNAFSPTNIRSQRLTSNTDSVTLTMEHIGGLYSESNSVSSTASQYVTIEKSIITGGTASSNTATATISDVAGIKATENASAGGAVYVTVTGATATSGGAAKANVTNVSGIIATNEITLERSGEIRTAITGGSASATQAGNASAIISGIYAAKNGDDIINDGRVRVAIAGGSAAAPNGTSALATIGEVVALKSIDGAVTSNNQIIMTVTGGNNVISGGTGTASPSFDARIANIAGIISDGDAVNNHITNLTLTRGFYANDEPDNVNLSFSGITGIKSHDGVARNNSIISITINEAEDISSPNGDDISTRYLVGMYGDSAINTNRITMDITGAQNTSSDETIYCAMGIGSDSTVEDSGDIAMKVDAVTQIMMGNAVADLSYVYGIDADSTISKTGGSLEIEVGQGNAQSINGDASAILSHIYGLQAAGTVNNEGSVQITATGSSATSRTATSTATADVSDIYGIQAGTDITTTGGSVSLQVGQHTAQSTNGDANASLSNIYGLQSNGTVNNQGSVRVVTSGSSATSSNIDKTATVNITEVHGINATGAVVNSGTTDVFAQGNYLNAASSFSGQISNISAITSGGTLHNSGDTRTSILGTSLLSMQDSSSSSTANAAISNIYGLKAPDNIINSGDVYVSAEGGLTVANTTETATITNVAGIQSASGSVDNSNAVTVIVDGGNNYMPNSTGSSTTFNGQITNIQGISAQTGITNSDDVAVTVTRGYASDSGTLNLQVTNVGGLLTTATSNTINNSGSVIVIAEEGLHPAPLTGNIEMSDIYGVKGNAVNNTGRVDVTATSEGALDDVHAITATGVVVNNGTVSLATSTSAGSNAITDSYGITGSEVTNTGTVAVRATSGGALENIHAVTTTGNVVNGGTVSLTTSSSAGSSGTTNSYGIKGNDVTNTGGIAVTANSGSALGNVHAVTATGDVVNSGTVSLTTSTSAGTSGITNSYGIAGSDVTNTGTIAVTATSGGALENAYAISATGAVVNEGTITFETSSSAIANVSTVHLYGSGDKSIDSCEIIPLPTTSTQSQTYAVTFKGEGTNLIYGYALQFNPVDMDEETTAIQGSGQILDATETGYSVQFSDNATLYAFMGNITEGFQFNQYYEIPELVTSAPTTGFKQVVQKHPEMEVYMKTDSDENITHLSFGYVPPATMMESSMRALQHNVQSIVNTVTDHLTDTVLLKIIHDTRKGTATACADDSTPTIVGVKPKLPPLGPVETSLEDVIPSEPIVKQQTNKLQLFAIPNYSFSSDSESMIGYKGRSFGVTLGGNYSFQPNIIAGLHIGYNRYNLDYTCSTMDMYDSREDNQDIYSYGAQGLFSFDNHWYLRGVTSFFHILHDYSGRGGMDGDTPESAKYNSFSNLTNALAGYRFIWRDNIFIPEAGLQLFYASQEEFTVKAEDDGTMNTTYGSYSDAELYFIFNGRWTREFILANGGALHPTLGFGFQQVLTDGRTKIEQAPPTATPVEFSIMNSQQLYYARGSLYYTQGSGTMELGYNGAFATDTVTHNLWFTMGYGF